MPSAVEVGQLEVGCGRASQQRGPIGRRRRERDDVLLGIDHDRATERTAEGADIEVEDCRWTPCYDCGVCPEMNTEIQIGPTGRSLIPLTVV